MFFLLSVHPILSCQLGIHTHRDEVSFFVSPRLLSSQHPSLPITPDPEGDCGRQEGKKAVNNYMFNVFISAAVNNFLNYVSVIL